MDFEPAELHAIGLMQRARKTLPDDFWLVAGLQELVCLYARIEPLLTESQRQTLIGCGALMARESEKEMLADIQARMAIGRAQSALRDS